MIFVRKNKDPVNGDCALICSLSVWVAGLAAGPIESTVRLEWYCRVKINSPLYILCLASCSTVRLK
jgi:hypothetical protein